MTDIQKIYEMTFREYRIRMKAARLTALDQEYLIARLAWQTREVGAMRSAGKGKRKPVYTSFKKFFDYEKQEKDILEPDIEMNVNANKYLEYMRSKQHG